MKKHNTFKSTMIACSSQSWMWHQLWRSGTSSSS